MTTLDADSIPSAVHGLPDATAHPLTSKRRSPCSFANRIVPDSDLCAMFEAIHPPAEPTNEQPWRFLVARRNDPTEFERLLSCIAPANHASAMEAPVLVLSIVTLNFSKSDGRNHAALRDLGLACANLAMAALVRGYSVHQIMGIFPERVRDLYRVPECFAAWTSMAIGYQENTHSLPAVLPQRETTTQGQHRASQFVFTGSWGQPSFQAARS